MSNDKSNEQKPKLILEQNKDQEKETKKEDTCCCHLISNPYVKTVICPVHGQVKP